MAKLIAAILLIFCGAVQAQIVTDGSVGSQITLNGVDLEVPETLGARRGNNLFHSFQAFSIDAGSSATFTGAADISHVISRVTGGEESVIQGTMRSQVGNADFYFVNPAGVTFTAGASVDVPASFHLSTADELSFSDGFVLALGSNADSALSIAAPAAFGFLDTASSTISVLDTNLQVNAGTLNVETSNFIVSGGEISGSGGVEINVGNQLTLLSGGSITSDTYTSADASNVRVASEQLFIDGQGSEFFTGISSDALADSGNAGNVDVSVTELITIQNGGVISSATSADGNAGNVVISAGQLLIDGQNSGGVTGIRSDSISGSTGSAGSIEVAVAGSATVQNGGLIISDTTTEGSAGDVSIFVGQEFRVLGGSEVSSSTFAQGDAGNLSVSAAQLFIDSLDSGLFTALASSTHNGIGDAGNIDVSVAGTAIIQNGGLITASTETNGNAGNISFSSVQLFIDRLGSFLNDGQTGIVSDSDRGATGNAGSVDVNFTEFAVIENGGQISSSTASNGNAGNVSVSGPRLWIDSLGSEGLTGLASQSTETATTGNAGNLAVSISEFVAVQNGGLITSDTFSDGDAGNVQITANQLFVDGQAGPGITGILSNANPGSSGDAGSVEIEVEEQVSIINGGKIVSETFSVGDAGIVLLTANELLIDRMEGIDVTGILSSAVQASGNGGTVIVDIAEQATLQNGGVITSRTFEQGSAGNVQLNARNLVIDGQGLHSETGIFSDSLLVESPGHAGSVDVTIAEMATIKNGGIISTNTASNGDAGSVTLRAGQLLIDNLGTVASRTKPESTGNAGIVEIVVTDAATIQNGGSIISDTDSLGDAGNVFIQAGAATIQNSGLVSSSTGSDGNAGNVLVEIDGDLTIQNENSQVNSATAGNGGGGDIFIDVGGTFRLENNGWVNNNAYADGHGGNMTVVADELFIDSRGGQFTGFASNALGGIDSTGDAGLIDVTVRGLATIQNGGLITTATASLGNGGTATLTARELLIDRFSTDLNSTQTGILSDSNPGSGNAGNVDVFIEEVATIRNGALISTGTQSDRDAGNVIFTARTLDIDGLDSSTETGVASGAEMGSSGNAGTVLVIVDELLHLQKGVITSTTQSTGDAGSVTVTAGELLATDNSRIVSNAFESASAGFITETNAGTVFIDVEGSADIHDSTISTIVSTSGEAGTTRVTARELSLVSSIVSSETFFNGQAGRVEVDIVEMAAIEQDSFVSSSTFGDGDAGSVSVSAGQLMIDGAGRGDGNTGIASKAFENANGKAGTVELTVKGLASVQGGGVVETSATGNEAGPVTVNAGSLMLKNGLISTTTESDSLSGGDITIDSEVLIMKNGMIQANANSGEGGSINVDSAIVRFADKLAIGGEQRATFQLDGPNVMQAVAPTGVSVPPTINAPDIDISGILSGLDSNFEDTTDLVDDPCAAFVAGAPSSLTTVTRGGLQEKVPGYTFELDGESAERINQAVSSSSRQQRDDLVVRNKGSRSISATCG